jgi:hypothetical protein
MSFEAFCLRRLMAAIGHTRIRFFSRQIRPLACLARSVPVDTTGSLRNDIRLGCGLNIARV